VRFEDGSTFRFHALWLRDACRDAHHVSTKAGERILAQTPISTGCPVDLTATTAQTKEGGGLLLHWSDGGTESSYSGDFLRAYADTVAQSLNGAGRSRSATDVDWLRPYSGLPGVPAPGNEQLDLWRNGPGEADFPRLTRASLTKPEVNLEFMRLLMRHGVVVVDDVPDAEGAHALHDFCSACLGGLQKDPAREEANWRIVKKTGATSISYNQDLRLNQHTDQSIPSHGIPALVLVVHYLNGQGMNTLTDGFACARALRERDPEAFHHLATHGNDQERDLIRSRVDADQNHTQSLLISTGAPILQLDARGNLARVQYNEVFRTPSSLTYEVFPKWFEAYRKFVGMVHSSEFEREVRLQRGQILVMQNWRVLHGRGANSQSADRTLVGGTVTREALYSRARQLLAETTSKELYGAQLFSA